jgi:hypothetical protein
MIEVGGASPPSLAARDVEDAVFADFHTDELRRWPVEALRDGGAPPLGANPDTAPGGEPFAGEADGETAAWLPAVLGFGAVWLTAAPEEKKGRMVKAR